MGERAVLAPITDSDVDDVATFLHAEMNDRVEASAWATAMRSPGMDTGISTVDGVIETIGVALGIEDRAANFDASTELLDSLPELDSMAIVALIVALEDHFEIEGDEDAISGEIFETVGSLATFVEEQRS